MRTLTIILLALTLTGCHRVMRNSVPVAGVVIDQNDPPYYGHRDYDVPIAVPVAPAWVDQMAELSDIGQVISGSVVDKVDPSVTRYAKIEMDCFGQLVNTLDIYRDSQTPQNLQGVQAMVAALDLNGEQVFNLHLMHRDGTDPKIAEVLQLLDQVICEISALVPTAPAVVPVMDPDRIAGRKHLALGWRRVDIHDRYNAIAKEQTFAPLP